MILSNVMNNEVIQQYHRHRYPYILLDTVDEIEPGKSAHAHKCFTEDEWLFHCNEKPDQPVPFTMLIEVLTEAFLMPILVLDDNKGKITNFISADKVKVYADVYQGDRLDVDVDVKSWRRGVEAGYACGKVDGKLVCEANLIFVIPEIMEHFRPAARKQ